MITLFSPRSLTRDFCIQCFVFHALVTEVSADDPSSVRRPPQVVLRPLLDNRAVSLMMSSYAAAV